MKSITTALVQEVYEYQAIIQQLLDIYAKQPQSWKGDTSLLFAGCDLDQMITELGFDRAMNLILISGKDDVVKLSDHLSMAEGTQIASLFAGGTTRMLFFHFSKVSLYFSTLNLVSSQDMSCRCGRFFFSKSKNNFSFSLPGRHFTMKTAC